MASKHTGRKISSIRVCKNKVVLYLCGEKLDISKEIYSSMYLYKGKEINDETYKILKQSINEDTYLKYALKLLSRKDYSIHQLKERLILKGANYQTINNVIKYLKDNKLVDDGLLAISYVESMSNMFYGKNRIKRKLMEKGIDYKVVDEMLNDNIEIEKCKKYYPTAIKKFASVPSVKKKISIQNHLLNKGYDINVIKTVLRDLFKEETSNNLDTLKKEFTKAYTYYKDENDNIYDVKKRVIEKLLHKGYKYSDIIKIVEEMENDFN